MSLTAVADTEVDGGLRTASNYSNIAARCRSHSLLRRFDKNIVLSVKIVGVASSHEVFALLLKRFAL